MFVNLSAHLQALRAKHAGGGNPSWGIDGKKGELVDAAQAEIVESLTVKLQTIKTAIESATMLLRIDDIVSGISSKARDQQQAPASGQQPSLDEQAETFGDARDG